ncbi:MAG TPA: hypothetical protein VF832_02070, partial [Longimicrobiales bacterium]
MASDTHSGVRGVERRSKLIVALLLLMVMMTGVLTYQAQDAARSYRATAERALNAYAGVAAWHLSQNAQEVLYSTMLQDIEGIHAQLPSSRGVPDAAFPGARTLENCHCFAGEEKGIRFALTDGGRTLISERPLPPQTRAWIRDSSYDRPEGAAYRGWHLSLAFPRGAGTAVEFAKRPGADGRAQVLVGVVRPAQDVASFFPTL